MKNKILIVSIFFLIGGCKKQQNENLPLVVLGQINNHTVSELQANKIAILQSIYPESLKKISKKMSSKNSSSGTNGQIQNPAKTIKNTFSVNYDKTDANFISLIIMKEVLL
ncbi:MAG: hypothetical protein EOO91_12015 [Pedobacter sp.]|nr:MAG: hypothetical protein EOO91_12015 [Pedobacter sp.]